MKIEKLILKNYAGIKVACNTTKLEIDFTKSQNKIILLTGPNGSGKTTILSCLHPFATNGNLDVRDGNSLILEGKEGYKELQLREGDIIYTIQHYYHPSQNKHTVKSYIQKNGVELNENGNVTSFKDMIQEELHIDQDYLKLARLGSNVTNFIDMKATDRKTFMGKILNSVTIYLKVYKKITDDMKKVKSVMSHIISKMDRLGIQDIEEAKDTLKKLEKETREKREEVESCRAKINILDHELSSHENGLVLKESLEETKKQLTKIYRVLDKKESTISLAECNETLQEIEKEIIQYTSKGESLRNQSVQYTNTLDELLEERSDIEREFKKIEEDEQIKDTKYMIAEIKEKIATRAKNREVNDYPHKVTKKEIEDLIITLDNQMDILTTTYEFGLEPIKKAISYLESGQSIASYVETHNLTVEKNKLQMACEYVYNTFSHTVTAFKPNCKKDHVSCTIMKFFNFVYENATSEPDTIIEDSDFITYTKMAYQNISTVIKNISMVRSTIERLPDPIKNLFLSHVLLDKVARGTIIYDRELLYRELTLVTEYELQEEDRKTLATLKEKLQLLENSSGNRDYLEKRLKDIKRLLEETNLNLDTLDISMREVSTSIRVKQEEREMLLELRESLEKKEDIETRYESLSSEYTSVREYTIQKKELLETLDKITFAYKKLEQDTSYLRYNIQSYEDLITELDSYKTTYEEMEIIKDATSPTKDGIPLLYVDLYLGDVLGIVNELLDIIYEGDLFIEKFDITPTEFRIPYYIKSHPVDDVIESSQGEGSFISIALSFALICQSLSEYNIMLLDEIDSTLDKTNRSAFIQILEKMIEMIGSEQIFLISHNDMFDMYPVDVIHTKNEHHHDNGISNPIPIKFS